MPPKLLPGEAYCLVCSGHGALTEDCEDGTTEDVFCHRCDGTGIIVIAEEARCDACGCFPSLDRCRRDEADGPQCPCHKYSDGVSKAGPEIMRIYSVVLEFTGIAADNPSERFLTDWNQLPGFGIATFLINSVEHRRWEIEPIQLPKALGSGTIARYCWLFSITVETDISITGEPDEWEWSAMFGIENNVVRTVEYQCHTRMVQDIASGDLVAISEDKDEAADLVSAET